MSAATMIHIRPGQPISRHFPPSLRQAGLKESDWKSFCDDYDDLVAEGLMAMISWVPCLVPTFALLGFALAAYGGYSSVNNSSTSFSVSPILVFGLIIFIGFPMGTICLMSRLSLQMTGALEDLCGRYNARHGSYVSFAFKEEHIPTVYHNSDGHLRSGTTSKYYIQITPLNRGGGGQHNNIEVTDPELGMTPIATPMPTPIVEATVLGDNNSNYNYRKESEVVVPSSKNYQNNNASPRERLQHLENIRDLLSPEEYQRKRQDILNNL